MTGSPTARLRGLSFLQTGAWSRCHEEWSGLDFVHLSSRPVSMVKDSDKQNLFGSYQPAEYSTIQFKICAVRKFHYCALPYRCTSKSTRFTIDVDCSSTSV
jgi:hypothetical protein